jgi:hypothetical protein
MKEFGPEHVPDLDKGHKSDELSKPVFATLLPCPIIKYITLIINI